MTIECSTAQDAMSRWFTTSKDVSGPILVPYPIAEHIKVCPACQRESDALESAVSYWKEWPYKLPDIIPEGAEDQATAYTLALRITRFVLTMAKDKGQSYYLARSELLLLCSILTEMASSGRYMKILSQLPTVIQKVAEHLISADLLPGPDASSKVDRAADQLVKSLQEDVAPAAMVAVVGAAERQDWSSVMNHCNEMLASPEELSPTETSFFLQHRAQAHLEAEEYQRCVDDCTQALTIEQSTGALITRMRAFRRMGKKEEALADCNAAIALTTSDTQRQGLERYRTRITGPQE